MNLLLAIQKAADSGWTGGLGRHWVTPFSKQDALVEVFIDPEMMGDDRLLVSLRDVTAEYLEEQKHLGMTDQLQHLLAGVEMAVTR